MNILAAPFPAEPIKLLAGGRPAPIFPLLSKRQRQRPNKEKMKKKTKTTESFIFLFRSDWFTNENVLSHNAFKFLKVFFTFVYVWCNSVANAD